MRSLICYLAAAIAWVMPAGAVAADQPAALQSLIDKIDIPYQAFTLDNGLRVIVHTDRKTPVVAVSVWYNVGSKHEPKGKTGFAHLFEHLMFAGSENASGDYLTRLESIGASGLNGTTWFDRTNYFQTVPTGALEQALYLESDRMGHLLGALSQERLDNQRGVVQNEKRQGDNQPYGLFEYAQLAALLPPDHPYGHSTIGSMADLDSASLEDFQNWFRQHYGPNNAILVLAGDIDVNTAKSLVQKYFGHIARGPSQMLPTVTIPTLQARKDETMHDRVATTRLYRSWVVPGLNDPDAAPLDLAVSILGDLSSSRLKNVLVRDQKLATDVQAVVLGFSQLGLVEISVDIQSGVDPVQAGQRLDAVIADFLAQGPTTEEVQRAGTDTIAQWLAGIETVGAAAGAPGGGKAAILAQGLLYSDDPAFYKKQLAAYAQATPDQIKTAAAKWLSRPVYAATILPGAREAYEEAVGKPSAKAKPVAVPATLKRDPLPAITDGRDLDFPTVQRDQLANGIPVVYVQRDSIPVTRVAVSFDAGFAADPKNGLGTNALVMAMLKEGTKTLNSVQIAQRQEQLGANIDTEANVDRSIINLTALTANLGLSLDLLADITRNPAFAANEVDRLRKQQLAKIADENVNPRTIGLRVLPPLLFGAGHPYGVSFTGSGQSAELAKVGANDLAAYHQTWFRPETATLFITSDQPLASLKPLLNSRFGDWKVKGTPGQKNLAAAVPVTKSRIVLVDRKDSPQSLILGGQVLPVRGTDDLTLLNAGNDALGSFAGRFNQNLRETKGWSYGAFSSVNQLVGPSIYFTQAPVQTDKTGPSVQALLQDFAEFLSTKGVTSNELERIRQGRIRRLPGSYEASAAVLRVLRSNEMYKRPDDYVEGLAARYRAMSAADLDQAMRAALRPDQMLWVVVGDADKVRSQLDQVGLPVQTMTIQP